MTLHQEHDCFGRVRTYAGVEPTAREVQSKPS